MDSKVKSIFAMVFLLGIDPILTVDGTPIFDSKCLTQSEYSILIGYFIKQTVLDIQMNRPSEAMETLNKISPNDDRYVLDIVAEALKQPEPKLFHLLEFINQTKLPSTTLDGMTSIFTFLNDTKHPKYPDNRRSEIQAALNWLDLQHFAENFAHRHANNSGTSTKITAFFNNVENKTKRAICITDLSFIYEKYERGNGGNVKYVPEHLRFLIKYYFENSTTESVIHTLDSLYPLYEKTLCRLLIEAYAFIKNSAASKDIFKLMPAFKLSSERFDCKCNTEALQLKNGSLFQKILSQNYFLLKNVHSDKYLFVRQNAGKSGFTIKTVPESDSDKVNWKFSAYKHNRDDRIILTIRNRNFEFNNLRALPCLLVDQKFVVRMQTSKYQNDEMVSDAWNIDVDDMDGERFRLQNDFTKGYLAVGIDKNEGSIILIDELNAENRDRAHWTLEETNEKIENSLSQFSEWNGERSSCNGAVANTEIATYDLAYDTYADYD